MRCERADRVELDAFLLGATGDAELDAFRRCAENLYERVRTLFFLYAIHRFHLPGRSQKSEVRSQNSFLPSEF